MIRHSIVIILACALFPVTVTAANTEVATIPITKDGLRLMPVPDDSKNYFILQSFKKTTNVIIGDFGGAEKIICLIIDKESDNTIDEVIEYYPETASFGYPAKPTSRLFSDYPKIKKDIIEGSVFKDSSRAGGTEYTHEMSSLPILMLRIKEGRYVSRRGTNGIYVRNIDPDLRSSIMSDFYFAKVQGEYFLQFRTNYYKSGTSKTEPLIQYSVYCRESSDPVVKEYVEMLLKKAREKRTE